MTFNITYGLGVSTGVSELILAEVTDTTLISVLDSTLSPERISASVTHVIEATIDTSDLNSELQLDIDSSLCK